MSADWTPEVGMKVTWGHGIVPATLMTIDEDVRGLVCVDDEYDCYRLMPMADLRPWEDQ